MKSTVKICGAYILIFLTGLLIGAGAMHLWDCKRSKPPKFKNFKVRVCEQLSSKLELNDEQRKYLYKVMDEHFAKIKAMQRSRQPQIIALINDTYAKLGAKLDPQQQKKLEEHRLSIINRIKRRAKN